LTPPEPPSRNDAAPSAKSVSPRDPDDFRLGRVFALIAIVSVCLSWIVGGGGWLWAISHATSRAETEKAVGVLRLGARIALLTNLVAIAFGIPGIRLTRGSRWRAGAIVALTMGILGLLGVALLFFAADVMQSCGSCDAKGLR
jgi:hypothetical protein